LKLLGLRPLGGLGTLFMSLFIFAETTMAGLYIIGEQGGDFSTATYAITFFALGNLCSLPLGDRFNHKKLFQWFAPLFLFTTILASFMPTYFLYNFMRFLQGVTSGPFFVVIPSLLLSFATSEERNAYIRNILVCTMSSATIGGAIGGAIAYEFHWQWILLFDLIGYLPFYLLFLYEIRPLQVESPKKRFDMAGYLLYLFNISAFVIFFTMGQQLDWFRSGFLRSIALISAVTIPLFILYEQKHPYPLLDFHILRKKNVLFALFNMTILFGTFYGVNAMLSIWLHVYIEYSVSYIAIMMAVMTFAIIFVFIIASHPKYNKNLTTLFIGVSLITASSIFSMFFSADVNFGRIVLARTIEGVGQALFLPPLYHILLDDLDQKDVLGGIALYQIARSLGSGLGPAIIVQVWERRAAFYHSRLGGDLTQFSVLTRETLRKMIPFRLSEDQRIAELNHALTSQVQTLAINDTFFLIASILSILLIMIPFFAYNQRKRAEII